MGQAADGTEQDSPNRQRRHWLLAGQAYENAPTLRQSRDRGWRSVRVGRPDQVVQVRLLRQDGVDVVLRLARLQLGQDGDEAPTERGRNLREEGEELLICGVLQSVLEAGREHRSTTC